MDIVVSVESQVAVVRVTGAVASAGEVHDLADRLLSSVPPAGPVIVDLSLVDVAPDELAWLVLRFEAAPHWHRFRLVDTRLEVRRVLRSVCRRAPVLPDVDTALRTARGEVPAGTPQVDIVSLGPPSPSSAGRAATGASVDAAPREVVPDR